MRRMTPALALLIGLAVLLASPQAAFAGKDEFENGFKRELGAIGARSVVGVGVGLFNVAVGGEAGYDGNYVYPQHGYGYYHGGTVYRERSTTIYYPSGHHEYQSYSQCRPGCGHAHHGYRSHGYGGHWRHGGHYARHHRHTSRCGHRYTAYRQFNGHRSRH